MRAIIVDELLRAVMTRGDVARYLQCSIGTVRNYERREWLTPKKIGNAFVFESSEVETLGRKLNATAPVRAKDGELAARAFAMFDASTPFREIVKALRVKPDKVKQWYMDWRTPIEEAYARAIAEKKAKLATKQARAHDTMLTAERRQDKHDLAKFDREMSVLTKALKGGKK